MYKKIFALLMILSLTIFSGGCGEQQNTKQSLVIYTSMKESLIGGIIEGFKKQNPGVVIDYQSAGAGKIMAKLEAERQSGQMLADIIWTSEVPDFYEMKSEGMLEQYQPSNFNEILNPFDDYDGSFTAARLGTLGIVINTDKVTTAPTEWEEIATNPLYKDAFGIADPALSGTALMSIALLEKQFGWDYLVRLHDNGAIKSKGSGRVVDDTATGELVACLGVDYITAAKIDKGANLRLVYPKELLMVPSPVAILKDAPNKEIAKKFVDYILSQEAQQMIADSGTVPVRRDIKMPEKYDLPAPEVVLDTGIKINYNEIMQNKERIVNEFSELFK